jgi:hypothetical protein
LGEVAVSRVKAFGMSKVEVRLGPEALVGGFGLRHVGELEDEEDSTKAVKHDDVEALVYIWNVYAAE